MRKIVFSAWATLDGFVSGPEDGKMEWLRGDAQLMEYEQSFVDAADTLLLGRKTFNDFFKYWPPLANGQDPGAQPLPMPMDQQRRYARTIDPMKKIVISASGDVAAWQNSTVLPTIDAAQISALKLEHGKNMAIYGSVGIVRELTKLGLLDEYDLLVHPVFLGKGTRIFNDVSEGFELKAAQPFASGVVLLKYTKTTSAEKE